MNVLKMGCNRMCINKMVSVPFSFPSITFNEKDKGVIISSNSERIWKYFERMGIEPYRDTEDDRWYKLESKHQIVLKTIPAKKPRCSKMSCTF